MSTDIFGWVELQWAPEEGLENAYWAGLQNLSWTVESDYDVFGVLFGVRGEGFPGLEQANYGRPQYISPEMAIELKEYPSTLKLHWISWEYVAPLEKDGKLVYTRSVVEIFLKRDGVLKPVGEGYRTGLLCAEQEHELHRQGELDTRKYLYRVRKEPFEHVLPPEWKALFDFCNRAAERYSAQNIRLVAFFE